ncbi:MAG: N-acetylmuramoyl-L-alanine amidase [Clostridia bacterium]|nr:N-acetylmuramoyl-L-alanine amidase [Clostridia bacterium]
MKNIFLCVKKRWILSAVAVGLAIPLVAGLFSIKNTSSPKPEYTIVIDAGHGGRDGGAVGATSGVSESELNLKYAQELKALCEQFGVGVVMTRSDMNGLYDENASNKKRSEMEKRREIINSSGADLMVSIHMNSFSLPSSEGAYVFYAKGSDEGFNLAKSIQTSLCKSIEGARNYVTVGDYFVLNYSAIPSALVECGFLSNPKEEQKLCDENYRKEFCYSLLVGILSYFKN